MTTSTRLQSVIDANPDLKVFFRGGLHSRIMDAIDVAVVTNRGLAGSVANGLIAPDKHLLPTTESEVLEHWMIGDAIIVSDKKYETAKAYTANMPRFGEVIKSQLKVDKDIPELTEHYCVVVDKEDREKGLGTAIVYELLRNHQRVAEDITTFVTFQDTVVRLFGKASKWLREDGMNITFRAFGGEELPMLYPFLTLANPHKYSAEEIEGIEGTNPVFKVDGKVLQAVNQFLSGKEYVSFSLNDTNMFFISDVEKAYQADAALKKAFVTPDTLKEALISLEYTI